MNQTRRIAISSKIFTARDLHRIADIFDRQMTPAEKSQHDARVSYAVTFSDDTTLESDSPDLFLEDSLNLPGRPETVKMGFHNYKLGRDAQFAVSHGNSSYGNFASASAPDMQWLGQMFLGLQDALGAVRPQQTWPRRYKALLLIAIALGIGTIVSALSDLLLAAVVSRFDISAIIVPLRPDSPWRKLFTDARKYLYLMGWLWRLFLGMLWGAPWVRSWLLSAWPSIELDFGPPHLHKEKTKRQRLLAVATLVVLPILVNVIYDLGKSFAK